jgi:hypothetical protein
VGAFFSPKAGKRNEAESRLAGRSLGFRGSPVLRGASQIGSPLPAVRYTLSAIRCPLNAAYIFAGFMLNRKVKQGGIAKFNEIDISRKPFNSIWL